MTRSPLHGGGRSWAFAAFAIALPTSLPLLVVLGALPRIDATLWAHFLQTLLPNVIGNTLWLMLGVGLGVSLLGTALGALIALTEFPGRRVFAWLLLLPLAMPGYVLATVVISLFDYAGPVASQLRQWGWTIPPIRSGGGLALTLSLTLYPYVYLVSRNAFASQGMHSLEAARMLGYSPLQAFWKVALPQARPWIFGGTLLALMETVADFGTASAFGISTFTTAIYRAWFALFSIDAALQLAAALILLVTLLVVLERRSRRHARFDRYTCVHARLPLGRWRWAATAGCTLVVACAFVLPGLQLLAWTISSTHWGARELALARNSLLLGLGASLLVVTLGAILALAARMRRQRAVQAAQTLATLGYALPGPLVALGLYVPYAACAVWLHQRFGFDGLLQGGLGLLLLAYLVRFLAVGHTPQRVQLLRLSPRVDDSLRLLGLPAWRRLLQVWLPTLTPALLSGGLLVLVDVMKEIPITLMMRPFGWDTLAVRVFELTREGEWQRAALPSLMIVATGLLPLILISRRLETEP